MPPVGLLHPQIHVGLEVVEEAMSAGQYQPNGDGQRLWPREKIYYVRPGNPPVTIFTFFVSLPAGMGSPKHLRKHVSFGPRSL